MLWQFILFMLSFLLFFGFVILGVCKYGLLSCYSAYGPKWREYTFNTAGIFNIWSAVTTWSALLLLPVLLQNSEGSAWQIAGFLCPALIAIVGLTPDYGENNHALYIHLFCAAAGALFAVLYVIFVFPQFWWMIVLYVGLAALCTIIFGKWSWNFWFEMAAYLLIYTTIGLIIF